METVRRYFDEMKHQEDYLAVQYLPAVKAMAGRLKERLPSSVEFVDLCAIGTEELVKLARRYNEAQNDSFWGYAKSRVYGAMLDYLRSLDLLSRSNRALVKKIDTAIERFMVENETLPTDEEIAGVIGVEPEKVHEARIASQVYTVIPLQDQLTHGDEGAALERIETDELVEVIKRVLQQFNEREQLIIQLYYFEEMTLKEISNILKITESRISQIHKAVISKIQKAVVAKDE